MGSIIQFVGDPFVDAGVAVLECRLNKPCSDFSEVDLQDQADRLEDLYARKAWTGYLTVHFPNSCWCNFTMGAEKKKQQKDILLRSFNSASVPSRSCVYCHRPAQQIADRSAIPLLTGATTMTSGPGGEPGLPVCAACLYAIQFYPLATLKVLGRPLFWWTSHEQWMFQLTNDFARKIEQVVEASPEQVTSLLWPSTRLLETAEAILNHGLDLPLVDLLGCHATNYGSGPDYEEIRIRRGVLDFLRAAQQYPAYRTIVRSAWESPGSKKKKKKPEVTEEVQPDRGRRNFLFEDLTASLKQDSFKPASTIRRHFRPYAGKEPGIFELTCIYARKVLEMTQEQVDAIKELAGQIASSRQAESYLERLFQRRGLTNYVRILTEISDRMKRAKEQPLSTDTILRAFDLTNEDDATAQNAALVREIILIRLIEVLPQERLSTLPQLESGKEEEE